MTLEFDHLSVVIPQVIVRFSNKQEQTEKL